MDFMNVICLTLDIFNWVTIEITRLRPYNGESKDARNLGEAPDISKHIQSLQYHQSLTQLQQKAQIKIKSADLSLQSMLEKLIYVVKILIEKKKQT